MEDGKLDFLTESLKFEISTLAHISAFYFIISFGLSSFALLWKFQTLKFPPGL